MRYYYGLVKMVTGGQVMPMKISRAILLLVVVTLCATFSMRMFQGLDEVMGEHYWVVDTARGDDGWYMMGLLPHVKKLPRGVVKAVNTDPAAGEKYLIYAQNGDFAGKSLYGVCFGISLVMYLLWFAFILGFPDRVAPYLLPRRMFCLAAIGISSIIVNLLVMRIAASFARDPMARIASVAGSHVSLLFHVAGIWFAVLFLVLGAHNRPMVERSAPDSRSWPTPVNGRPSWMFILLGVVTCLGISLVHNRLA